MKNLPLPIKVFLAAIVLVFGGCAYPGSDQQAKLMFGEDDITGLQAGIEFGYRLAEFNLASHDEKFALCVMAGDIKKAEKYVTPKNVNKLIEGKVPPIVVAVALGNEPMLKMLLAHGANIKSRNPQGYSLAALAAGYGHNDLAYKLVRMGGGTAADVAKGKRAYAHNSCRCTNCKHH